MGDVIETLMLYDGKHPPCFITKNKYYSSAIEFIVALSEPHFLTYSLKSISREDLYTDEELDAWYTVNTSKIPNFFEPGRDTFTYSFEVLWEVGKEVAYYV